MSRQDFENRCRAHLAELDRLTELLGADLARLRAALPLDRSGAERLRATHQCSDNLRTTLEEAARLAGLTPPIWTDRATLGTALDALFAAWTEAESVRPRAALVDLAAYVERGRLRHRLPSKRNRLEALRLRVVTELQQAGQGSAPPPPLPGFEKADGWLSWAWQQDGEALERLVQDLQPFFPALADLLTEGELDWWQEGSATVESEAANGIPTPLAPLPPPPAAPTEAAPPEVSVPKVAEESAEQPVPPVTPAPTRSTRPPIRPAALIRLPAPVRPPTPPRVVVPPPPPPPEEALAPLLPEWKRRPLRACRLRRWPRHPGRQPGHPVLSANLRPLVRRRSRAWSCNHHHRRRSRTHGRRPGPCPS